MDRWAPATVVVPSFVGFESQSAWFDPKRGEGGVHLGGGRRTGGLGIAFFERLVGAVEAWRTRCRRATRRGRSRSRWLPRQSGCPAALSWSRNAKRGSLPAPVFSKGPLRRMASAFVEVLSPLAPSVNERLTLPLSIWVCPEKVSLEQRLGASRSASAGRDQPGTGDYGGQRNCRTDGGVLQECPQRFDPAGALQRLLRDRTRISLASGACPPSRFARWR